MFKIKALHFLFLGIFLFLGGERSVCGHEISVYPGLHVFYFNVGRVSANYYVLSRCEEVSSNHKNLLIIFEGSGKHSVLGKKNSHGWDSVSLAHLFNKELLKGMDILVPERISLELGAEYRDNQSGCEDNFRNKVTLYPDMIDQFLCLHPEYCRVIMMGYSEGGSLLPRLYQKLNHKNRISGLILCSSGGLSFYESLQVQKKSNLLFPDKYRQSLDILEPSVLAIRQHPFSKDMFYFGRPYIKWAYFLSYRPMDDLLTVSIPILVLHGDKDLNIPVESSRGIGKAFQKAGKHNYRYIEYKNTNHFFNGDYSKMIQDINAWISLEF